ncbi:MAG: TIM barrel protein [Pirellulales bacterium]
MVVPGELNDEARLILDVLRRHDVHPQLWVTGGGGPLAPEQEDAWIDAEVARLRPIAEAAAEVGCSVGLYNHGGWFGEPENQIKIIERLQEPNVGIVYNLHHGHAHLDRFAELLERMRPHLLALNLNGMTADGEARGQKILPLGAGELDLALLRTIRDSGYDGPIGILNHTDEDAEARLADNLDGLAWLLPQLDGVAVGPRPIYRSWSRPYDEQFVAELAEAAGSEGIADHGVAVFASVQNACLSCHKIGRHGGSVGPDLTTIGSQRSAQQIVESLHWPSRTVAPEYTAVSVLTIDGKLHEGYAVRSNDRRILLREPTSETTIEIPRSEIEAESPRGSLMPDGVTAAMSRREQLDLVRLLAGLGKDDTPKLADVEAVLAHA